MSAFVVVTEQHENGPDVQLIGDGDITDAEIIYLSDWPASKHCEMSEVPGYVERYLQLLDRADLPDEVRQIVQRLFDNVKARYEDSEWDELMLGFEVLGDGDDEVHAWIVLIVEPPEGESTQYTGMTVVGDDSGGVLRPMTEAEAAGLATAWNNDTTEGGSAVPVELFHYDRCPLGAVGRCLSDEHQEGT